MTSLKEYHTATTSYYGRVRTTFKDTLPQLRGNSLILDLGCSQGFTTRELSEIYPGSSVVGIDNNPQVVGEARQSYPHLTFIHGDGLNFPYPMTFNAVFAMNNLAFSQTFNPGFILPKLPGVGSLVNPHGYFLMSRSGEFAIFKRGKAKNSRFELVSRNIIATDGLERFLAVKSALNRR